MGYNLDQKPVNVTGADVQKGTTIYLWNDNYVFNEGDDKPATKGRVMLLFFKEVTVGETPLDWITSLNDLYSTYGSTNFGIYLICYNMNIPIDISDLINAIAPYNIQFNVICDSAWASSITKPFFDYFGGTVADPFYYLIDECCRISAKNLGMIAENVISSALAAPTIIEVSPSLSSPHKTLNPVGITFSKGVLNAKTKTNYALSGTGKGTYPDNPDDAQEDIGLFKKYNLSIITGSPVDGNLRITLSNITDRLQSPKPLVSTELDFTMDVTPPRAVLNNKPPEITNSQYASFIVGGDDVIKYKYKFDEETAYRAETPCSEYITKSDFSERTHTIYVLAMDTAGNWQPETDPTTYSWIVDLTAPTAELFDKPAPKTKYDYIDIRVGGADVKKYQYNLDNLGWQPEVDIDINPIIHVSGLLATSHTIAVVGMDTAENWRSKDFPTTYNWEIDITAPTAVLSNTPPDSTTSPTIDVIVGGDDVIKYKYKIDNGLWKGPFDIPSQNIIHEDNLSEGTHTLYVVGMDTATNWQQDTSPTFDQWTIDFGIPVASLTNPPSAYTSSGMTDFIVGGDHVAFYRCRLETESDYGDVFPISTPLHKEISTEGSQKIYVIGGNATQTLWQPISSPTTYSWVIDRTPPVVTECTRTSTSPTTTSPASFRIKGSDINGIAAWALTDTTAQPSSWTPVVPPSTSPTISAPFPVSISGTRNVFPWLKDVAGNVSVLTPTTPRSEVTFGRNPWAGILLRDTLYDNGNVPSSGSMCASPDIICSGQTYYSNPAQQYPNYGTAYMVNPVAGRTNYFYVRAKNMGASLGEADAEVFLYITNSNLLMTPSNWTYKLTPTDSITNYSRNPFPINAGEQNKFAKYAFRFLAPTDGYHYCSIAVASTAANRWDPQNLPRLNSVVGFSYFVSYNPNICWKNLSIVTVPSGSGSGTKMMRSHEFDEKENFKHIWKDELNNDLEDMALVINVRAENMPRGSVVRMAVPEIGIKQTEFTIQKDQDIEEIYSECVELKKHVKSAVRMEVTLPKGVVPDQAKVTVSVFAGVRSAQLAAMHLVTDFSGVNIELNKRLKALKKADAIIGKPGGGDLKIPTGFVLAGSCSTMFTNTTQVEYKWPIWHSHHQTFPYKK